MWRKTTSPARTSANGGGRTRMRVDRRAPARRRTCGRQIVACLLLQQDLAHAPETAFAARQHGHAKLTFGVRMLQREDAHGKLSENDHVDVSPLSSRANRPLDFAVMARDVTATEKIEGPLDGGAIE